MQLEDTAHNRFDHEIRYPAVREELGLWDVFLLLKRRWKPILLFSLGAAILSALICLILPPAYTAKTVLMPPTQSSPAAALLSQLGGAGGGLAAAAGASLGMKTPGDLYVSLFHSRTVEEAMVQRFDLMKRYHYTKMSGAREGLERHSKVAFTSKDGLLTISVTDGNPKMASDMANGYVEAYRKLSATLAITEAAQRRLFFEQQLLEAKENLTKAEEALKNTQQSTGVLQIDSQTRALIESATSLRAQIVAKQVQLQGMRTYGTDENPEILQNEQQLAAMQSQLAKLGATDAGTGLLVPKGKVSEEGLEYIRKVRDVKYYDTISQLMAMQFEMAKLDEARQGAVLQVVDPAVPPDNKSFPQRRIIVSLATLFALCAICGYYIALEMIRRKKQVEALSAV